MELWQTTEEGLCTGAGEECWFYRRRTRTLVPCHGLAENGDRCGILCRGIISAHLCPLCYKTKFMKEWPGHPLCKGPACTSARYQLKNLLRNEGRWWHPALLRPSDEAVPMIRSNREGHQQEAQRATDPAADNGQARPVNEGQGGHQGERWVIPAGHAQPPPPPPGPPAAQQERAQMRTDEPPPPPAWDNTGHGRLPAGGIGGGMPDWWGAQGNHEYSLQASHAQVRGQRQQEEMVRWTCELARAVGEMAAEIRLIREAVERRTQPARR